MNDTPARPDNDSDQADFIDLRQASAIGQTSTRTLRRAISRGDLPAYRFGLKFIRVKRSDVLALMRPIPNARSNESGR